MVTIVESLETGAPLSEENHLLCWILSSFSMRDGSCYFFCPGSDNLSKGTEAERVAVRYDVKVNFLFRERA